jgi:hypothetical protein
MKNMLTIRKWRANHQMIHDLTSKLLTFLKEEKIAMKLREISTSEFC